MPIIIKNLNGYRKAEHIIKVDAEALVAEGKAAVAPGYPDIYEEASVAEIENQGYLTRSMVALAPTKPAKPVVKQAAKPKPPAPDAVETEGGEV